MGGRGGRAIRGLTLRLSSRRRFPVRRPEPTYGSTILKRVLRPWPLRLRRGSPKPHVRVDSANRTPFAVPCVIAHAPRSRRLPSTPLPPSASCSTVRAHRWFTTTPPVRSPHFALTS